jgi:multidrug resistance efflux pump
MRWKAVLWAAAALAAAGTALGLWWAWSRPADGLKLPGVVEIQEVRLGSKIGGRVAEVLVREGDLVRPGQVLVKLEAPELEAQAAQQQAKLREARAAYERAYNGPRKEEIASARAARDEALARLSKMKAGNRKEEIRKARADVEAAEARAQLAREDLGRAQALTKTPALSRADYDSCRSAAERTAQELQSARAFLDLLEAGFRPEDVEEAAAAFEKFRQQHELLLAGTRPEDKAEAEARVDEAAARLRELEANLKEAVVAAPEAAVVEVLAVRKGDLVAPNQPILRVLRTADLWVKVYVPETELGRVRLGQEVEVTVDCFRDRRFQGTVVQINSASEFTPRNVQSVDERRHQVFGVRVQIDDPQGVFKSGMAAEVFIPFRN